MIMPPRLTGCRWMRGSPVGGAPTSSSSVTPCARARRRREFEGRSAGTGLESGQCADRDAGLGGEVGERGPAFLAQGAQAGSGCDQRIFQVVVHAT